MQPSDVNAGQWSVVVQTAGEILAAAAVESSIELGVLGLPGGYDPAEIEGWLHDLIGVARETGRLDEKTRPIPALLHHGLTGLLFSHAQLWNRAGERHPASYAVVHGEGRVGFGWIGDASVMVLVGGQPADPGEIIVRDEEGREARAFQLPDGDPVDVRLEWSPGGGPVVVLEATWSGTRAAPAAEHDALRELIERPFTPHPAPDFPVAPMEALQRETLPGTSFLENSGEPLDLSAMPAAAFETAGHFGAAHEAASGAPEDAPAQAGFPAAAAGSAAPDLTAAAPHAAPPQAPAAASAPHVAASAPHVAPPPAPAVTSAPHVPASIAPAPDPSEGAPFGRTQDDPAESPAAAAMVPGTRLDEAPSLEDEAALATLEHGETVETADEQSDDMFAPAAHEEARPSRLRRLFDRFAFWRHEDDARGQGGAAHDVAGVPEQVPPSPEPADLTARAVREALAPEAEEELIGAAPLATASPHGDDRVAPSAADANANVEPGGAATPVEVHDADAAHVHGPMIEPHVVEPAAQAAAPVHVAEPDAIDEPHPAAVEAAQAVHEALTPAAPPVRTPLRPQWPAAEELQPAPLWKRPWVWAVLIVGLFAGGWVIGHMNDERRVGATRGMRNVLRSVGLGGARFEVMVNSRPSGAWIAVDGEDLARRTPASIELEPGEHDITLSFSDLGEATFKVRGTDGERVALDPPLWGGVRVYSSDEQVPVAVSIDGVARGFAPLSADSLQPGPHEIRFSGPGLPSWGQTVQVRIQETQDLIARPMTSPATGVIEVRASLATESGTVDVEGAKVWLDTEAAGVTPLTLELPRGPHSIRVEHLGESAPVQVIDLPGGNQRFASFQLHPGADFPVLAPIDPPAEIPLDRPTVVSMGLDGVASTEVREMWLHVQTPDGPWRRYQLAWLKSTGGVVGVAVFPTTMFDADGRVRYYASASTQGGDEYFSEVHVASREGAASAATAARSRRR